PWFFELAGTTSLRAGLLSGAIFSVVLHAACCTWMIHVMGRYTDLGLLVELLTYGVGLVTVIPYGAVVGLAGAAWVRRWGRGAFRTPRVLPTKAEGSTARIIAPDTVESLPWRADEPVEASAVRVALVQGSVSQEVVVEPHPGDEQRRAELELQMTRVALAEGA